MNLIPVRNASSIASREQLILNANPTRAAIRLREGGHRTIRTQREGTTDAGDSDGRRSQPQSVFAMADNKTDRLPPTQFPLAGDVKSPAELEHADFLLTDHPKAAVALDAARHLGLRRSPNRTSRRRTRLSVRSRPHAGLAWPTKPGPVGVYRLEEKRITAELLPKGGAIRHASRRGSNIAGRIPNED